MLARGLSASVRMWRATSRKETVASPPTPTTSTSPLGPAMPLWYVLTHFAAVQMATEDRCFSQLLLNIYLSVLCTSLILLHPQTFVCLTFLQPNQAAE